MKVEKRKVSDLIPYVNNTRTHSDEQITQIAASIKEFGFTNPVLIDKDNGVIAGHGRVLAAKKLKMDEVPCIVLDNLTEAQKKAYIIADNKIALNAGWDEELLKVEIETLQDMDFDIDILGFDDIDYILGYNDEDFEFQPLEDGEEQEVKSLAEASGVELSSITFVFEPEKAEEIREIIKDIPIEVRGEIIYKTFKEIEK